MKLKKWLSRFLVVAMLLSIIPQPGSTVSASEVVKDGNIAEQAEADKPDDAEAASKESLSANNVTTPEEEPKDESFGGFADDVGFTVGDDDSGIAPQSLLNLEEVQASLILNQYTEEQLKSVSLDTVLNNLKDRDGNKIEISGDAQIVWGYYKKENGERIDDEFHKIGRDETVDLSAEYEWENSYEMQLIVGSGAQLDAKNIRYIITVYVNDIYEWLSYNLLVEDASYGYRDSIYSVDVAYAESSLLKDAGVPVTEVSYYVQSDSRYYQEGDTCYLGIHSTIAGDSDREDIKVDVYPMQKFMEFRQNGGQLQGAITEQILNQENLYTEGGYAGKYLASENADPLALDNLFCMVYSDAKTGAILGYQGLLFVIRTNEPPEVSGAIYTYENGQMKEISKERDGVNGNDAGWSLNLNADPGDGLVDYYIYGTTYRLIEGYPSNAEYYYVIDENTQIDKVVKGFYNSREEAEKNGAEDITAQVFPTDRTKAPFGYKADYYHDQEFTVFFKDGMSVRYYVYAYASSTSTSDPDIYFNIQGAKDYTSSDVIYKINSTRLDSYCKYNRQTVLINDMDVDLSKLVPIFTVGEGMKAYVGTEQISGETEQDFSHGPVQYTVRTDKDIKNYWVTFAKKESGSKLFVNGPEERDVFLTEYFENRHDILIANLGDAELTGLKVELQNPVHIKLDDYWVVGGEKNETLAAFTDTYSSTSHGELNNLAKIRLLPDGDGLVSGTLKVSANGQEPVYIKLKGYAGNPKIVTEGLTDAVKYVPYSFVVATNNMLNSNKVTFSLRGKLPEGVTFNEKTGEIYGIPQESGEFPVRIRASYSMKEFVDSTAELTLKVQENTNDYVYGATDQGYEIREHIGRETSAGTHDYILSKKGDQLFVSAGEFPNFINLWLNGQPLVEGEDYTKESGSTRITIQSQTFANKASQDGTNTLAAEFREGSGEVKDLKRTAQNFRIDYSKGGNSGSGSGPGGSSKGSGSGSGGSGGSSDSGSGGSAALASTASTLATFVFRLVDTANNPLANMTVELHSTPKVAQTNANGIVAFSGVESGAHTLYVKDGNGNILSSKSLEILFGDTVLLNGNQLTVKAGSAFTLNAQMNGNELAFVSIQDGDFYQILPAPTGDTNNIALWVVVLFLSCGMGYALYTYNKKKKQYQQ